MVKLKKVNKKEKKVLRHEQIIEESNFGFFKVLYSNL